MKSRHISKWRITQMEQWDQDFIDLVVPGYINFDKGGDGSFQFGAVEGEIDYRIEEVGIIKRLEFTWAGYDEGDPVCGRGWAVLDGDELHGGLYFHMGDDSWFKARRIK